MLIPVQTSSDIQVQKHLSKMKGEMRKQANFCIKILYSNDNETRLSLRIKEVQILINVTCTFSFNPIGPGVYF